jgi:phasin
MMDVKLPNFEPPEELRDFAGRTVEQARKLSNDFFETARKATAGLNGAQFPPGAGAQNIIAKWLDYAEQNTNAGFDHAARLVRAKDMQQAMQLQAEFVRSQFAATQQQLQELGTGMQPAAPGASVGATATRKR